MPYGQNFSRKYFSIDIKALRAIDDILCALVSLWLNEIVINIIKNR